MTDPGVKLLDQIIREETEKILRAEAVRSEAMNLRERILILSAKPVDENGCHTLPDGSCDSPGPCIHTPKPAERNTGLETACGPYGDVRKVEFDIVHIKQRDGRCVISVDGQGHFPCSEHSESQARVQVDNEGVKLFDRAGEQISPPKPVSQSEEESGHPMNFDQKTSCSSCKCSACSDDPHYSSYHCKHATTYGELEGRGFCIATGFVPSDSWRRNTEAYPLLENSRESDETPSRRVDDTRTVDDPLAH